MKKAAIYMRVSTLKDQTTDSQAHALNEYCGARGYSIYKQYEDIGISGAKVSRPRLNDLMADAVRRRFDVVLVYRFDRFARSSRHLLHALEQFKSLGIGFISVSEAIDTNTPMGEAMFTIIAALSALERNIIAERVKSGLASARAKGKQLGAPIKASNPEVLRLRSEGVSIREIAKRLNLTKSVVEYAVRKYPCPSASKNEMVSGIEVEQKGVGIKKC